MSMYNGVFKKSIDVSVIAKQSAPAKENDSSKEHSIVFFNKSNDIADVAYSVEVSEGISYPFTLKLTVLSSLKPSRTELKNDLLFSKYTVTLRQDNESSDAVSARVKRERKFKGIVTSYAFRGSVPSAQNLEKSCYVYELTIEPELVLLSLKKRTCHYSGMSVIEIIQDLFKKHDLQSYCEIDLSHFGQDKFDDKSFVFEQNQETDLEFLNRILRQFSINYCFDDSRDDYKVSFSRSSSVYSHFPVTTQEDTTKDTVVNAIVNPNLELKAGDNSYIFNAYYKGSSLQGSIYSDEEDAFFSDKVESNLNTDIAGNSKQLYYINESHNKIRNILDEYLVLSASDLVFASGVNFLLKDEVSCFNNCQCLIVRSYLKFNVAYPSYFASSDLYEKTESTLTQKFVAIPIDNAIDAVLGPIGVFKKLDNLDLHNGKDLDTCFGLTKVSESRGSKNNQSVTVTGFVCNAKGEISDDNEVNRIALESNKSNYDKFYVKVSSDGSEPSVVICNYLSSYLGVNNLPKLGQKVVMLFTGCKYYLLGIMPKETIGLSDEAIQNKQADSVLIKNNDGSSAFSLGAKTDIKAAIREKLLSHELSSYVGLLNIQNNSLLPKEIFETNQINLEYDKAVLASGDEDLVELTHVSFSKTYKEWAEYLLSEISSVEKLKEDVSQKLKSYELQNEKDEDECKKLRSYYKKCEASLGSLLQTTKVYSTNLEKSLSDYVSIDSSDNVTIKSNGSVKTTSESSNNSGESSSVDVSSKGGVTVTSSRTTDSDKKGKAGQVNISADGKVTIKSENSIAFQVGNSSIVIDAGGITLSSRKFKEESVLWDSAISIDSMGSVKISASDTIINSFSSSTVSDSFGGRFSTVGGKVCVKGNFINVATQTRGEVVDNLATLSTSLAKLVTSSIKSGANYGDEQIRDANRCVLLYSDLMNSYTNITSIIRNIGEAINSSGGQRFSFICTCFMSLLKIVDLIEDIVITSIDIDERKNNDETWEKRDSSNNYISSRDVFRLTTSAMSKALFIASSIPAICAEMKASSVSSIIMSADKKTENTPKNIWFTKDWKLVSSATTGTTSTTTESSSTTTDSSSTTTDSSSTTTESSSTTTGASSTTTGTTSTTTGTTSTTTETTSTTTGTTSTTTETTSTTTGTVVKK